MAVQTLAGQEVNHQTPVEHDDGTSQLVLPNISFGRREGLSPEAEDVSRVLLASENDMRVAIAQITTDPGRIQHNTDKIIRHIQRARGEGARLVVFPELAIPGYGHMDLAWQESYIHENKMALQRIAEEAQGITAIVGFIDQDPDLTAPGGRPVLYNSSAVVEDGNIIAVRDKVLLPSYNIFYEDRYFSPGKRRGTFEAAGKTMGLGICEDLWDEGYDEKIYPGLISDGAEMLLNLSASPFHVGKFLERQQQIEKVLGGQKLPFIYSNLVGSFDGYYGEVVFDGRSMVFDSQGKLGGVAGAFQEDLFLFDMHEPGSLVLPDVKELPELHDALVLGIREYFRRCGFEKAYIGLSGGIDSALVAALAVEALGKENVIGVTMPSHITSGETKSDAYKLAANLGIECEERPIRSEYKAWIQDFRARYGQEPESITKQNKQARIRGNTLMEKTNEDRSGLVISTGNKTELALGYCTLYGDMAGGFAAISDVSKERVYALARYINQKAGQDIIPTTTIERPPTAELEEGQTDENSLPAGYDVLSPLVDDIVDRELPREELYQKYKPEVVDKVLRMIKINEYKRRQAAPGIRVTPRAFGIGRRFPI